MKFILLLTLLADAGAPVRSNSMFCEMVRSYVAVYGQDAAEKWAQRKKWSKASIAEARACLTK